MDMRIPTLFHSLRPSGAALGLLVVVLLALGVSAPTAFAARAEGSCPNEALRSELGSSLLPDCRAYEMVSPAYKEGYPILFDATGGAYSASGDEGIVYSLGDLAGAQGASEDPIAGALYGVARTSGGWRLSSLNAPLSQFVGQIPMAVEADDGYTLWKQHTPEQSALTRDLYVRSPTGGYSLIGPLGYNPAAGEEEASNVITQGVVGIARPVATTAGYEHVVLEAPSREGRWPFDTTVRGDSLYEYSGTNNYQPILVGVNGPKESDELIRSCGTELGSGGKREGSEYNALSASGEAVFFTVESCESSEGESAEIYERLHGSVISDKEASTVDVSASECDGCGTVSGKNFEGASENGERVYFTSTQKLTGGAVDGTASGSAVEVGEKGGCSHAKTGGGCNLYEYVSAPGGGQGHLQTVAGGGVLGVAGIAEDGARVYYVSRGEVPGAGDGSREGSNNLYVYDALTGQTTFIAILGEGNQRIWGKIFALKPVEVAGNEGQFLLFVSSTRELVPGDKSKVAQLFEYDAETGELERITQGEDGYNENGNAVSTGIVPESISTVVQSLGEADFKSTVNHLNISEDGRTVVFSTTGQLSERAISANQGCTSVYEFRTAGKLSQGGVHLISDGRDTQLHQSSTACGAEFLAMDTSGANILFSTADELVPSDTDGVQRDIYDAREDGGFPAAPVVAGAACEGAGCEGVVSASPPVFGAPASASLTGSGNLVPPAPVSVAPARLKAKVSKCPKGKHRNAKGKCVKPAPKKKQARGKKAGKANRRSK